MSFSSSLSCFACLWRVSASCDGWGRAASLSVHRSFVAACLPLVRQEGVFAVGEYVVFVLLNARHDDELEFCVKPGESLGQALVWMLNRAIVGRRGFDAREAPFFESGDFILAQVADGSAEPFWLELEVAPATFGEGYEWDAFSVPDEWVPPFDACPACGTEDVGRFAQYGRDLCDDCVVQYESETDEMPYLGLNE